MLPPEGTFYLWSKWPEGDPAQLWNQLGRSQCLRHARQHHERARLFSNQPDRVRRNGRACAPGVPGRRAARAMRRRIRFRSLLCDEPGVTADSSFPPPAISSQSSSSSIRWKASSPISSLARMASTAWRAAWSAPRWMSLCAERLAVACVTHPLRGRQMRRELLTDGVGDRRSVVARSSRAPHCKRALARGAELAADRVVVMQIERAQQRLERQSLHRRACRARRRTPSARSGRGTETPPAAPAPRPARRCRACRPTR